MFRFIDLNQKLKSRSSVNISMDENELILTKWSLFILIIAISALALMVQSQRLRRRRLGVVQENMANRKIQSYINLYHEIRIRMPDLNYSKLIDARGIKFDGLEYRFYKSKEEVLEDLLMVSDRWGNYRIFVLDNEILTVYKFIGGFEDANLKLIKSEHNNGPERKNNAKKYG
jgi:hypothetical protein